MPEVDTLEDRLTNPRFQARFEENPPPNKVQLQRAWKLLEEYSKIPEPEIETHAKAVVSSPPGPHFSMARKRV